MERPTFNKDEIKRMSIEEFVEKGFLQEANRQFFHPLGLAIEIYIDENNTYKLNGIWDYRHEPEGILFDFKNSSEERINKALGKKELVNAELEKHKEHRIKLFGDLVEPIG